MYSQNDYRYYLEHRLMESDDFLAHYGLVSGEAYLAHHGVVGMKWGQRKERYNARMASNNAKIQRLTTKLNTVGAQKRKAKAAKYQAKVDKLQRKASKAQKRLAQGKSLSGGQQKKLMKYEQYKAKVAKNSYKNDKFQAKINKLQTKNARIQRRINRGDMKQEIRDYKTAYKHVSKGIQNNLANEVNRKKALAKQSTYLVSNDGKGGVRSVNTKTLYKQQKSAYNQAKKDLRKEERAGIKEIKKKYKNK